MKRDEYTVFRQAQNDERAALGTLPAPPPFTCAWCALERGESEAAGEPSGQRRLPNGRDLSNRARLTEKSAA